MSKEYLPKCETGGVLLTIKYLLIVYLKYKEYLRVCKILSTYKKVQY